jgi:hypothetical protein
MSPLVADVDSQRKTEVGVLVTAPMVAHGPILAEDFLNKQLICYVVSNDSQGSGSASNVIDRFLG